MMRVSDVRDPFYVVEILMDLAFDDFTVFIFAFLSGDIDHQTKS